MQRLFFLRSFVGGSGEPPRRAVQRVLRPLRRARSF